MNNIQKIETPYGDIMAKNVAYYDNGNVKSAEPEEPVFVSHEIGLFIAYDNTPLRDEAHEPTLELTENGRIQALRTVGTGLICRNGSGELKRFGAQWREDPRQTGAVVLVPIRIEFFENVLCVTDSDGQKEEIDLKTWDIQIDYLTDNIVMAGGCGDCSTCNGCKH